MKTLTELAREAMPMAFLDDVAADRLALGCVPEWDSLGNMNLLMLVEETYGIRFDPEQLSRLRSLQDILALVIAVDPQVKLG